MLKHVYPAWHKPAQRVLFLIGAILCITLPVIYGTSRRPRKISARSMGIVFGVYFGLWAVFSLIVRFLVPSPTIESTLPTYTPEPIPEPVFLHSPSRADAVPISPAIRQHHPSPVLTNTGTDTEATPVSPKEVAHRGGLGARFADDIITVESGGSAGIESPTGRHANNVTFQRGYTTDSNNSEAAYPTYAAYRQSQHGTYEAFAQRIKKAFATSQQEKENQQLKEEEEMEQAMTTGGEGIGLQSLVPTGPGYSSDNNNNSLNASTTSLPSKGRSRSGSGATNIFGGLAERIRDGSLFTRSQTFVPSRRSSTDPQAVFENTLSRSSQQQQQHPAQRLSRSTSVLDVLSSGVEVIVNPEDIETANTGEVDDGIQPLSLANVVPLAGEKTGDEKEAEEERRRILQRRNSDDTVVVTMDGIRRPGANRHQGGNIVAQSPLSPPSPPAAAATLAAVVSPTLTNASTLEDVAGDKK
ncbi:hypothetical protein EDD21DRAFT_379903 [Dissophora ornata]|nr:hypothetical protein EDD21DRAFT_379903 [Dissophora ornata]